MHSFKLKILTPDNKLFDGQVLSITLPTDAGEITILKNHTSLISTISIGEIKIVDSDKSENVFFVQGGVLDIKENGEVVVLVDMKLDVDDLKNMDEEIARAKEAMKLNKEDIDFTELETNLERNIFLKRFQKK